MHRYSATHDWDTVVFFHSKPARSTFHGSVSYARPIASRTRRSFSRPATPAKPTRTLALPCPPQDWFSRLQRTKYEQLMPDLKLIPRICLSLTAFILFCLYLVYFIACLKSCFAVEKAVPATVEGRSDNITRRHSSLRWKPQTMCGDVVEMTGLDAPGV